MPLETQFDPAFAATLALREKQIQQSYRPIIGVHKWFARRPGTVFRNLLLAEYNGTEPLDASYWRSHHLRKVIADPFMGGGTTMFEANRLGCAVVGADINPMAYWVVRQSLAPLDLAAFRAAAEAVASDVASQIDVFYRTRCTRCGSDVEVKYFLWVKVQPCPSCGSDNDLFPGYLLAEATRHPKHVLACRHCGELNEFNRQPKKDTPEPCIACGRPVYIEGSAARQHVACRSCGWSYTYPAAEASQPPKHRLWALEYHCATCKPSHRGRFFKRPDARDLENYENACARLRQEGGLPIPDDAIPAGDETDRLHRWGYQRYRDMFNDRQLLGLGLLLRRIRRVEDTEVRRALLTVFSDFLRYQNMLCRYDTYALKCQDIFSIHGFPVGLIQCENNVLGIRRVGSGAFRHFVEKYVRAKAYCRAPFETRYRGKRKQVVRVPGERIEAHFVDELPAGGGRDAYLAARPATEVPLIADALDGVFTDPPYYDNVQYAELMDFCFVWLRLGLADEIVAFRRGTTRSDHELTGNTTLGRGLEHFTEGLSEVFRHYAGALKPAAPFTFTYHHNEIAAYVPLVVAILDAGMRCTAVLPAVAEMSASLHIAGTTSSVVDSVFVCRVGATTQCEDVADAVRSDVAALRTGGVKVTGGDVRCLATGHLARAAVNQLASAWDGAASLGARMAAAQVCLEGLARTWAVATLAAEVIPSSINTMGSGDMPIQGVLLAADGSCEEGG